MVNDSFLENDTIRVKEFSNKKMCIYLRLKNNIRIDSVVIDFDYNILKLRVPNLRDLKTVPLHGKKQNRNINSFIPDIEEGIYKIDLDESNQDEVVIYLEDKI